MNRKVGRTTLTISVAALIATVAWAGGCSSASSPSGFGPSSGSGGGSGGHGNGSSGGSSGGNTIDDGGIVGTFGDATSGPPMDASGQGCTNLQCQVQPCANGGSTPSAAR